MQVNSYNLRAVHNSPCEGIARRSWGRDMVTLTVQVIFIPGIASPYNLFVLKVNQMLLITIWKESDKSNSIKMILLRE